MKYYCDKDKKHFAVLITNDFGAGWSTWNIDYPEIAYDSRVVDFFFKYPRTSLYAVKEFLESLGYEDVYCGGFKHLQAVWIPFNTYWRIKEYDGHESIEYLDYNKWNYMELNND